MLKRTCARCGSPFPLPPGATRFVTCPACRRPSDPVQEMLAARAYRLLYRPAVGGVASENPSDDLVMRVVEAS